MYFINLLQSEMNIQITPVQTHVDNIGAAYMAEQVVTNKRTKHISPAYHYAREQVQIFKNYSLKYVNTLLNCSDIFTKPLDRDCSNDTVILYSKSKPKLGKITNGFTNAQHRRTAEVQTRATNKISLDVGLKCLNYSTNKDSCYAEFMVGCQYHS